MSVHTLEIPGQDTIKFDPEFPDQVEAALAAFTAAKEEKKMAAFANPNDPEKGGQVKEFDPSVETTRMVQQIAGG